jgi:hypothetical protein
MSILIRMAPNARLDRQLMNLFANSGEPFALELWSIRDPLCWYCGISLATGSDVTGSECPCWRCERVNYLRDVGGEVVITSSDDPSKRPVIA